MKKFLKGLAAAAAGGAVSVLADPHSVAEHPEQAARVAAAGAAIAVIGWLVKSPLKTTDDVKG